MKNLFYAHANGAAHVNYKGKPPTRKGRTTSAAPANSERVGALMLTTLSITALTLHRPIPFSTRHAIPTQEADNALAFRLTSRVSMGSVDQLISGDSHARLSLKNTIKRVQSES
ncbi:hypothetical protein EVAR_28912_1 [Eumeta japonica]|uniref:Uncharacterized protein n=1 Tax=Eumeta variegata TaxID=151549 RepID=A0A4C1X068_EUMVA|nr:hypothetical protein EVAR_28912_1 [Eumeta japonica]